MRYINKQQIKTWVFLATLMGGVFSICGARVAAIAGLTVTPATSTLSLAKSESEQRSTMTITNNYDIPVSLHFSFGTALNAAQRDKQAVEALAVSKPDVTLGAGQSVTQAIILSASDKLAPGSQQAELVIGQTAVGGNSVGVLPEIRLPLILVKEDGAITSLGLTNIEHGALGITMPATVQATIKNTGNMLAIPRGVVTVTAPDGTVVGQGTLNESSQAIAPGASVGMATRITKLASATLPGPYAINVRYGLGGDNAAKTASSGFVFIAWWHVAIVLALVALAYYVSHTVVPAVQYRRLKRRPPKQTVFAGRNAS